MKGQKNKKGADFLGLKVLSTLDERLIIGGATQTTHEDHDHVHDEAQKMYPGHDDIR